MAVAGIATPAAVLAALGMLIAHAVFKAPLFMVVGIVDKKFGTRDLRVLSEVWRSAPVVAVIGTLAAASMAAVPPLFGFVAKEAVFGALWEGGTAQRLLLVALVAGSVLTVAYSWRFVQGTFGKKHGCEPADAVRVPFSFWVAPAAIALACVVLPVFAHQTEEVLRGFSAQVSLLAADGTGAEADVHLAAIPHLGVPLLLSAVTLGTGVLLCALAQRLERFQHRVSPLNWAGGRLAQWIDSERVFRAGMRGLDLVAVSVTPLFQRGSLPYTLTTMLLVLIAVGTPLVLAGDLPDNTVLFHQPLEIVLFVVAVIAAIGAARSRRRLRAVLLITVTGYTTALFFLLAGAPDVALTQFLVDTIMTVAIILVLRRLPTHFSRRPLKLGHWFRWLVAIGASVVICAVMVLATGARVSDPLGKGLIEAAYTIGGGHNVVNVTLVDARVWDTMGEISVLLVVATGVASLIFVTRREQKLPRVRDLDQDTQIWRRGSDLSIPSNALDFDAGETPENDNRGLVWLPGTRTLAPERRMVILEVITRVCFPLMMLFSIYLLMAGHNAPGGGFAGGLVAGLAITLRYLAGGRHELTESLPVQPGTVLGVGMALAVLTAVIPLPFGGSIFTSAVVALEVPLIGEMHLTSALVFDVGVYLVVLGLVLDLLRSLGAQLDMHQEAEIDAD
jgi:multicomponent Na+:H+ antiporter subunit A